MARMVASIATSPTLSITAPQDRPALGPQPDIGTSDLLLGHVQWQPDRAPRIPVRAHNNDTSRKHTRCADATPASSHGVPEWLYVAIVATLCLYLIIGGIAWASFIFQGVPVPDSFTTLLATIAGGLVGVLAPSASGGRPPPAEQKPPPWGQ